MIRSLYRTVRYLSQPPQFSRSGNTLLSALKYVNEVDKFQDSMDKTSPDHAVAAQLVERIQEKPELLSILSLFHYELARLGITQDSSRTFTAAQVWRYRAAYVFKLAKIHNIFWELCRQVYVAERHHSLGFSPGKIGLLDPAYFDKSVYTQLQEGRLGDVDFRGVEMLGPSRFNL